jgi:hypothetical protein
MQEALRAKADSASINSSKITRDLSQSSFSVIVYPRSPSAAATAAAAAAAAAAGGSVRLGNSASHSTGTGSSTSSSSTSSSGYHRTSVLHSSRGSVGASSGSAHGSSGRGSLRDSNAWETPAQRSINSAVVRVSC